MPEISDTYLGDGVYASFDGYYIILDLRGQDSTTRIALEPEVLASLDNFRTRINRAIALKHAAQLEEQED